jgi:hypothetical protein
MSVTVRHTFASAKADSSDATLIQPSHWNAAHTVTDTAGVIVSTDYAFTAQAPGGSLTIGSNTITLSPIPSGLAVGNKLYISAGTGTAETVAITGWNSTTGVVIVTCANTHSGAWTIQSASAGIQEAIVVAYTAGGGKVIIPGGNHTLRGTINLYSYVNLEGYGNYSTILLRTGDYGDSFQAIQKDAMSFSRFQIQQTISYVAGTPGSASNLPTNGAHFNLKGCNTVTFTNVRFQDGYKNVSLTGGALIHFFFCQFSGTYDGRASSPKATIAQLQLEQYNATYGITTYVKLTSFMVMQVQL